ncbi:DUF1015 domain-containing protein [Dissulfurirhabdus thermomarina]|uniref:DUF1015 domain-containing protein n=1 Tax=Dissulfurirhabdus thermomarina TaxID=1765737 RepID=A0A6N9TLF3_DISTH|nr:DUF1015 domain-containing protein [Dissulfurirhabdus thermomarina]NDY42055.1 DUF1015 domain-containing protein [Dissulfurirhabdus thermomarina]NMX24529.1 DUF1015 domain-containing protein [Dissulfurirhabdus thermomarina]
MALVLPFRGVRYNPGPHPMEELVAPPYDVVDEIARDALVARNPQNVFQLELPPRRPGEAPEDACRRAGETFRRWRRQGLLVQDPAPAVYPYEIEFTLGRDTHRRTGLVALVRVEPWERRVILPHEHTFDRVTEDRLRLFAATQARFSQIFLFHRPLPEVGRVLAAAPRSPLYDVRDGQGCRHRLWRLDDPAAVSSLRAAFRDAVLYIADGHHRYTTALNYRRMMEAAHGSEPWRPYHYAMAYLVDAADPGLVVLPTHREVRLPGGMDPAQLLRAADRLFRREALETGSEAPAAAAREVADRLAERPEVPAFGVFLPERRGEIWWLTEEGRALVAARRPPELAALDVAVLEDAVLGALMGMDPETAAQEGDVRFFVDPAERMGRGDGGRAFFLLRATPVERVLDVADAGLVMPHKSTYFYPKILTGLVMHSLEPGEREEAAPEEG